MSTLYLHIGTPKTGTTSLQYFLSINRSSLRKNNYSYPKSTYSFPYVLPKQNAHFMIMRYYKENKKRDRERENALQTEGYAWLLQQLSQRENVILSDEGIWTTCDSFPHFWQHLNSVVRDAGHDLKVIVYLRRQDLFIQSYWNTRVRNGETLPFLTCVKEEKYAFCHFDYYSQLEHIASAIGRDSLVVRVYEDGQYAGMNGTIYSDFLYAIGLELTEDYHIPEEDRNISIDLLCTETKRILNRLPDFAYRKNFLINYMRDVSIQDKEMGIDTPFVLFPHKERVAFLEKYATENQLVAKNYLNRKDGKLFYDELQPPSEEITAKNYPLTIENYVETCGRIILAMRKSMLEEMQEDLEELQQQNHIYRQRIDQLEHRFPNQILHWLKQILVRS